MKPEEKTFECKVCGETFEDYPNLYLHYDDEHNSEYY